MDSFADPNSDLKKKTEEITAGATSDDQKLRKIYAAVMGLENTHYTRAHGQKEEKAEGGHAGKECCRRAEPKAWQQDPTHATFCGDGASGGDEELTSCWCRIEARRSFVPGWLSFRQFDDVIAIVNVDGKEKYFDPGCRYCAYGHLAWEHTLVQGLRQFDKGTEFGRTPGDDFKSNQLHGWRI